MKGIFIYLTVLVLSITSLQAQENDRKWYAPDHYKAQFAGNIGFLSVAAGYLHGMGKLETDLYGGFLPKAIGGDDIFTATLKSTYAPWSREINNTYSYKPFSVGLYLSYSFGSQFDTISPNEYPEGYYWWATSLRVGGFLGGSITKQLPNSNAFESMSLYYELGSYDLVFLSYIQNLKSIRIYDVVNLSIGVKMAL
ncbi:hypothetical protein E1176_06760 [Fulvivirga sp. RKSG066]|uniref:hypothetical protein n=1 Tax=Fulvivirga aurantia TaxID=2529383 RepID=UPI0012BD516F|nr:hypothetical protein [Fulvivirga aurantia]MTI20716.1 hypothetical protein [Fulvivirga aurantia]